MESSTSECKFAQQKWKYGTCIKIDKGIKIMKIYHNQSWGNFRLGGKNCNDLQYKMDNNE